MDYLNSLDRRKAAVVLRKCLPSSVWVEAMVIRRPFASIDDATSAARDVAASLREVEWNEVFASVAAGDGQRLPQTPRSNWGKRQRGNA